MKPTIRDISRATGFSPATVSNALNGKRGVNEETLREVLKTARELGYYAGPAEGSSKVRLVVFRDERPIPEGYNAASALINGIQEECSRLDYELSIQYLDRMDPDFERNARLLSEDEHTAIILTGEGITDEEYRFFENARSPLILVGYWNPQMKHTSVTVDYELAVGSMIDYLVRNGHRRIGHLKCNLKTPSYLAREIWYKESLEKNGLQFHEDYTVLLEPGLESSYQAMRTYLRTDHELPTAFFADSDEIALGAMKALQEAGYRVPEQISVTGFGDIPFAQIASPELSSVHISQKELGQMAVQYLFHSLRDTRPVRTRILLPSTLVARSSVRELKET